MRLHITSVVSSNANDDETIHISWAELEVPSAASTPPAIDTPTFTSVLTNGATLGGNITDLGTNPIADDHGTVWNHTGGSPTENASSLGAPSITAFTDPRTGMNTADQVFFRAFVEQSATKYYTAVSDFYTYPANDPTGFSIDQVTENSMRINWTDSSETGDAGGAIVIVSEVDGTIPAPTDGDEYTGDASYPFGTLVNGNDYVVYRGQAGGSVTLSNLPNSRQFWVAIYSYSGTGTGTSGVRYKTTTAITGTETTNTPSTPPAIDTPTFTSVLSNGATLGGNITDLGTNPTADDHGTVWNHTGGSPTENASSLGAPSITAFTDPRTGMNTADQVFFRAFVEQSATKYYTTVSSFYTYPANDPTGLNFTGTDHANITINWTPSTESGDAAGSIVVVSTADDGFTVPVDGTDYTPNAVYPFTSLGGNDYVIYKGTGSSVTITNLPELTTFYVAVYSASGLGTSGASGVRYKTDGTPATGNETTDAAPAVPAVILDTPAFDNVTSGGARLRGDITDLGSPTATQHGTVWNTTGNPTNADNASTLGAPSTGTFADTRSGMNSADQVFFKAYAYQDPTYYYSAQGSFYTYPANDPTSLTFPDTQTSSIQLSWTPSTGETGDSRESVVVISTDASFVHPVDGTVYAPDPSSPFAGAAQIGSSGDYVVYKGTGSTETVTGLSPNTQYWFRVYSSAGSGSGISGVRYKTDGTPAAGSDTTLVGAPVVGNPTFTSVLSDGATLGIDSVTGTAIDDKGTAWDYTTGVTEANNKLTFGTGEGAFSHARTGMNSADQVFFVGYAHNTGGYTLTSEASFHTYPANDPTGLNFTGTDHANITINWTPSTESGDATGSIVVVSEVDASITAPSDGTDYSPDASYPFSTATSGGNDYVVYTGTGSSVTITSLPELTTFYVAVYSASGLGTSGAPGVRYKIDGTPATGNETTDAAPAVPAVILDTPAFDNVTSGGARLRGDITDLGTPTATQHGTVYNYTGNPTDADNASTLGAPSTGPFTDTRSGMNSADQVFFKAYAYQDPTYYYSGEGSFYTYPANDPTSLTFPDTQTSSIQLSWTPSAGETGDSRESVVVISTDASFVHPVDGTDYTPDSSSPFDGAAQIGGSGDYVVYKGTGSTVTVTGLSPNTQYWFRVYSSAGSGPGISGVRYKTDGTPAAGNETTASGVTQASNPWFHNIGSTGMTLFWTAGIGDGSIVLMNEGSEVDADPVDGNDTYTANSVFGTGTEIGTGNFVVYKGNGTSVHITGLTQGLTYHVAIYTYTGAGVSIDYLQLDPAIGNQLTPDHTPHNAAILNVDDTVGCTSGCHGGPHSSGALVPRGAAQETMCISCHNADSLFDSAAKGLTDFALHTNSKNSPPATPSQPIAGLVDCGSCHELHNFGTESTHPVDGGDPKPNLHYIRADADKYVPSALSADMVLHNDTASADWAIPGSSYQGMCQVCHTLTPSGYMNDGSGQETSHQGGDDDCRLCHSHGTPQEGSGFGGGGGDCTGCHASAKDQDGDGGNPGRRAVMGEFSGGSIISSHLQGTIDAADCVVCHNHDTGSAHKAGKVNLLNADSGAGIEIASYIDPRSSQTEAEKLTVFCVSCHDSNGANGDTTPFTTAGIAVDIQSSLMEHTNDGSGSVGCFGDGNFGCHGSGHGGEKLAILTPAESGPGASPDYTDERETFCLTCHDGGLPTLSPPAPDILGFYEGTYTASTESVIADSDAFLNFGHDVLPADKDANQTATGGTRPVLTCTNCHLQPHDSTTGGPSIKDPDTVTLSDPLTTGTAYVRTYATGNTYNRDGYNFSYRSASDDYDPTNPVGGGSHDDTDYVDFCLICHDGNAPDGVTLSSNLLNIATTYRDNDYHGAIPDASTAINRGGMKEPWVVDDSVDVDPPKPYAAMPCTMCHGPHGSGNIYNLKTSINIAGTQMSTGSWGTGDPYDSIIGTYYEMPVIFNKGARVGRVWGAWCTFCHQLSGHGYAEDQVCRSGHIHGGNDF